MAKKQKQLQLEFSPAGRMVDELASRLGMSWAEAVQQLLYYRHDVTCAVKGGQLMSVSRVPGHPLGPGKISPTPIPRGPRQKHRVLVLTSHPNQLESTTQLYMTGAHGQEFFRACWNAGANPEDWYCTAVVKFLYPQNRTSPLASWPKEEAYLLQRELDIVDPDFILCMGAHAVEALFPGRLIGHLRGTVQNYRRSLVGFTYSAHNIIAQPEVQAEFHRDIGGFCQLLSGKNPFNQFMIRTDLLDTLEKLSAFVDSHMQYRTWVVDCEWGGRSPRAGQLRTIQLCWAAGQTAVVHLRRAGLVGEMPEVMDEKEAGKLLNKLLCRPEVRILGQFARSDLPWLDAIGVPLLDQLVRGFDTILGTHVLTPTDEQQLELSANKLVGYQRYDLEVREWVQAHKSLVERHAYGPVPDNILIPYAAHDVNAVYMTAPVILNKLKEPANAGLHDLVFKTTMPATAGIYEIEQQGFRIDYDRFQFFEARYQEKAAELATRIRNAIGWADFNPRSNQQRIDWLFGEQFNGKKDEDGRPKRIRPDGVECLNLEPVKTTGEKPLYWEDVVASRKTALYSPSTDDETLGILAAEAPILKDLRDYAYLEKACSNFFPEPEKVGNKMLYTGGIRYYLDPDGRLRTHISQLAETGRWRSFEVNDQNWPSQREGDFKRIFGDPDWPSIKSMMIPDEDDEVLVEADLKTAEVFGIAMLSGDVDMLHILLDPKRDIHSEKAIAWFHLPYKEGCGVSTKKWVAGQKAPVTGRVNKILLASELGGGEVWIGDKRVDIWPGHTVVVHEGQEVFEGRMLTEDYTPKRISAKCVVAGSRLHTTDGLIRVEDVVGAGLPADTGAPACEDAPRLATYREGVTTPTLAVYNGGVKPCLRVETEYGYRLESTAEHRYWVVQDDGTMGFRRAGDLQPGDWVAVREAEGPFGDDTVFPRVPVEARTNHKDLAFPEQFNEDWAAFLGLYLSEGSANPVEGHVQISLANEDDHEFASKAEDLLRRVFGDRLKARDVPYERCQDQRQFCVHAVDLARWLEAQTPLGSENLRVPDFVFRWPKRLLVPFLQWLFEGDGSSKANGKGFTIKYDTSSEGLARDVQQLLALFGVLADVTPEKRRGYDGTYWVVRVVYTSSRDRFVGRVGFLTERKRQACATSAEYTCDRRVIPHQQQHLSLLRGYIPLPARRKCSECLRANKPVDLNPTRLRIILEAVNLEGATPEAEAAYRHLADLAKVTAVFQPVRGVREIGLRQVYDVQTSEDLQHVVSYQNILTHQSVVFGVPYQRGALAVSRELRQFGVDCTKQDAQRYINAYYNDFQQAAKFIQFCKNSVKDPGFLRSVYGRWRYSAIIDDEAVMKAQEREFCNWPVQNIVADYISRVVRILHDAHKTCPVPFKIKNSTHDSITLCVKGKDVPYICEELLPACMCRNNIVPRLNFHFGIEMGISARRAAKSSNDELVARGVPSGYKAEDYNAKIVGTPEKVYPLD